MRQMNKPSLYLGPRVSNKWYILGNNIFQPPQPDTKGKDNGKGEESGEKKGEDGK